MVERCRVTVVVGLTLVVENGSVGGYSWHIGAARRPLTSPCPSLSLFVHLVSRHLSPSHLSIPPFPLTHPGLFFCTALPPSRPFRSPRVRARAHGRTRGNPGEPLHRLSPLRVCSSGFDRARHRSLHPLGISRCFPFSLPFISPLPSLPPWATLQSATTCIHPATKPPRLLGSTTINETVH